MVKRKWILMLTTEKSSVETVDEESESVSSGHVEAPVILVEESEPFSCSGPVEVSIEESVETPIEEQTCTKVQLPKQTSIPFEMCTHSADEEEVIIVQTRKRVCRRKTSSK